MNIRHRPELIDPEEFALSSAWDQYELIDGIPKEKPMGVESDGIAVAIVALLRTFVLPRGLGHVGGSQTGYRCFPDAPKLVRKPDASFVAKHRLPNSKLPKGDFLIAPDFAVEVISPNDLFEEVEEKLADYRSAGVRLVWIVSPGSRTVQIRRADGSCALVCETGDLSGEDVVPGFTCKVADLFV